MHKRIFVLVLIIFFTNSCNKNSLNPKNGEAYIVLLENGNFTTWKIDSTDKKTIWYICNDYEVSDKRAILEIQLSENYTDAPKSINKETFYKKLQSEEIKNLKNEE